MKSKNQPNQQYEQEYENLSSRNRIQVLETISEQSGAGSYSNRSTQNYRQIPNVKQNLFFQTNYMKKNAKYCNQEQCLSCLKSSIKIQQLCKAYENLISQKNSQIIQLKQIIITIEQKIVQYQQKNKKQLDKNKKLRNQMQKKHVQDYKDKSKQKTIIQYYKTRELSLLDQINTLQNQTYLKQLKAKAQYSHYQPSNTYSRNSSDPNLQTQNIGFKKNASSKFIEIQNLHQHSKQQINRHFESIYSTKSISRLPLLDILKKNNQIQCLKDNLMVSELKTKIQQTKNLELSCANQLNFNK